MSRKLLALNDSAYFCLQRIASLVKLDWTVALKRTLAISVPTRRLIQDQVGDRNQVPVATYIEALLFI